jgi:hypothetical protein
VLDHGLAHALPELLVRHLGPGDAHDTEALGQQVAESERVEGGHDLALREIAGGAEDRHGARLRRPPHAEAFEERVLGDLGHSAAFAFAASTACPPNW